MRKVNDLKIKIRKKKKKVKITVEVILRKPELNVFSSATETQTSH